MAANGRRRKKDDGLLVAELASGATVRDAAQKAGLSERTAGRRLSDPAFCKLVEDAKREIIARATARLGAFAVHSANALGTLLASEDERVKLSAARWILRLMMMARNHEELERRVVELETRIEDLKKRNP